MTFTGVSGLIGGTELLAGGAFTMAVAVAGVTVGMSVAVTPRTFPGNGIYWEGYVSAPGVVTIKVGTTIALFVTASLYDVQVNDVAGDGPQLESVTVTLTAAQINGMFAAPVQAIAAQGAGTVIFPTFVFFDAIFGSAAFAGGGTIQLFYSATSPPVSPATGGPPATFLTTFAANQIQSGNKSGSTILSALAVNQGIFISNQTAPFTLGTGCSMVVTIQYYVIPGVQ